MITIRFSEYEYDRALRAITARADELFESYHSPGVALEVKEMARLECHRYQDIIKLFEDAKEAQHENLNP